MSTMRTEKPQKEFSELLLEVRRVTRVTTGGRRMSFRATILVGNTKGKVGVGVAKGVDVSTAVSKASREAYKNIFTVPITRAKTVPYSIVTKFKACKVKLIPASQGTGLKAGSSVRSVLALAGFENVLSKILGTNNKLNNALATVQALGSYKHAQFFANALNKTGKVEAVESDKTDADKVENKETTHKEIVQVGSKKIEVETVKKEPVKAAKKDTSVVSEKKTEKKITSKPKKEEEKKPKKK